MRMSKKEKIKLEKRDKAYSDFIELYEQLKDCVFIIGKTYNQRVFDKYYSHNEYNKLIRVLNWIANDYEDGYTYNIRYIGDIFTRGSMYVEKIINEIVTHVYKYGCSKKELIEVNK